MCCIDMFGKTVVYSPRFYYKTTLTLRIHYPLELDTKYGMIVGGQRFDNDVYYEKSSTN